ncbi:MAG: hypothetical protein ACRD2W_03225 [Acidimicrobiales bacterium]
MPRMLRSRRVLFLLVAGGLLVPPALASAAATPSAPTKNFHVTKTDLSPARLYTSPYLSVDPSNPKVIVGVVAEFRSRRCHLVFTTNGGETWGVGQTLPAPDDYANCVWSNWAAQSAVGRNGHVYLAFTGWDDRDGGPRAGNMTMFVARTDDLGQSWQTTPVQTIRGKEGEAVEQHRPASLVVDRKSGSNDIVYLSFNRTQPNKVAPNQEPSRPMVAVSNDGGRTFGNPIDLSTGMFTDAVRREVFTSATTTTVSPTANTTTTTIPAAGSRAANPDQEANFGGSNPRLTMDDKGTVYAAWRNAQANVPNSRPVAPTTFVSVSSDKGKTWTTNKVTNYTVGSASRIAWTKHGGENGTLAIVFGRNPTTTTSGNGDIMVQTSTDQGKTWSEPKNITDDPPNAQVAQFTPTLSAAPNGRLDAAWWDIRDDPGIRANDVYYAYSEDGGQTWSKNVRISDQPINRTFGVWAVNFDVVSPIGVASTNELAVFAWDDTRNSAEDATSTLNTDGFGGGVQDVFASTVQFEALGAGGMSKTAKIVLAAAGGLAIVAIALLLGSLALRKGQPSTPKPAKKTDTEAPAKTGAK